MANTVCDPSRIGEARWTIYCLCANRCVTRLPRSVPTHLAKFRAALDCTERDNPYHVEKRSALWHDFDANGNVVRVG